MNCKWLDAVSPTGRALRIVVPYMVAAGLWVGLSDAVALWLAADAAAYVRLQSWKAAVFVLATGLLLHVLMREQFARIERSRAKARNLAARLRRMLESLDDLIFVFDDKLRFADAYYPDRTELLMPPEHFMGKGADEVGMPAEIGQALLRTRDERSTQSVEYALELPRGRCWYSAKLSPMVDEEGRFVGVIAVVRDITGLKASEQRCRSLFESLNNVAVQGYDADRRVVFWNGASEALYGYSREEALGRRLEELIIPPADRDEVVRLHRAWVDEGEPIPSSEIELLNRDGELVPVFSSHSMLRNELGEAEMYCVDVDLRELRETQAQLRRAATHDPLTGLPNRVLARDRFDQAMALAEREQTLLALLFVDLDRFKIINDTLGHGVGDRFLQEIGRRLSSCLRASDTISRQGGDEFLVVLSGLRDRGAVAAIAQKIIDAVQQPCDIDGHALSCSCSIGIAVQPDDGADFDSLLLRADTAMYQAKASGRNVFRFFTAQMNVDAHERLTMLNHLRNAIQHGELALHYQPQVDLASGRVVGAEALLRWQCAELGNVPPARFIPLAEESGLIIPIGEWVLREACRQAREWRDQGLELEVMAVNVSALQFHRGDPVEMVGRILGETGLPAEYLELELTESLLVQDGSGATLDTLRRLKALGLRIAIDDFGTGYSSLAYLRRFPIDKLKIDRAFVRDLASDADDAAIVNLIVDLGRILKLKTVAEGVEDHGQLTFLRERGCSEAQGYLFAKPMAPVEFSAYLGASFLLRGRESLPHAA
ncbi:putative bifunctional diguanylate cyclase/phosphodiesterase [Thauera sp. SDU_THAU2]|uniref:putative bifunctional diguanylate cyclase/phosphodiesterase n=1 Tax=Thauera sp. SDU_THAU2 TaxID=3136633 RepID=UPI00311EB469